MPTEKRVTLDLLDVRHHLDQHPTMYQVRRVPTTAMLVDVFTKHLPDQTVLENFMKNNVYSLREDPRLEEIRNKARAGKKERAKGKAMAKASTVHLQPRLHLQPGRENLQSGREHLQPGRELLPPVSEHFLRAHAEHLQHVILLRVRRKPSHLREALWPGSIAKI